MIRSISGTILLLIGLSGIVHMLAIGLYHVTAFDVIAPGAVLIAAWLLLRNST